MVTDAEPDRSAQPIVLTLLAVAALAWTLNLVWEYAQLPLYGGEGCCPPRIMLRATTVDMLLVTGTTAGALVVRGLLTRRGPPPASGRRRAAGGHNGPTAVFFAVLVAALAIIAAVIEIRAITGQRWSYGPLMPTVGIVGLSPLLQLPTTGVAACWVARAWRARPGG